MLLLLVPQELIIPLIFFHPVNKTISTTICDIPREECLFVGYIATDLFESYRTIAKILFWNSINIADRFHWIKLATQAFSKVRINTMNMYKKHSEKYKDKSYLNFFKITKKYHKILITNTHKKEL